MINLSPEKPRVFREAYRVLKPGGRLAISDIVMTKAMPDSLSEDSALISGCFAGAALVDDLTAMLRDAGFSNIRIRINEAGRAMVEQWFPGRGLGEHVAPATVEAAKPGKNIAVLPC